MHAFQTAASAFCIACICAEITTLLAGAGWADRCIKPLPGYISSDPVPAGPADEAGTEKCSGGGSGSGSSGNSGSGGESESGGSGSGGSSSGGGSESGGSSSGGGESSGGESAE